MQWAMMLRCVCLNRKIKIHKIEGRKVDIFTLFIFSEQHWECFTVYNKATASASAAAAGKKFNFPNLRFNNNDKSGIMEKYFSFANRPPFTFSPPPPLRPPLFVHSMAMFFYRKFPFFGRRKIEWVREKSLFHHSTSSIRLLLHTYFPYGAQCSSPSSFFG